MSFVAWLERVSDIVKFSLCILKYNFWIFLEINRLHLPENQVRCYRPFSIALFLQQTQTTTSSKPPENLPLPCLPPPLSLCPAPNSKDTPQFNHGSSLPEDKIGFPCVFSFYFVPLNTTPQSISYYCNRITASVFLPPNQWLLWILETIL